jgi:hypothetical protein
MLIIEPGVESKQRWRADVFPQQWIISFDIKIYRARIGTAVVRRTWKRMLENGEVESASWFMGIVLMVLLVVTGVEVNPGRPAEQVKIDQQTKS